MDSRSRPDRSGISSGAAAAMARGGGRLVGVAHGGPICRGANCRRGGTATAPFPGVFYSAASRLRVGAAASPRCSLREARIARYVHRRAPVGAGCEGRHAVDRPVWRTRRFDAEGMQPTGLLGAGVAGLERCSGPDEGAPPPFLRPLPGGATGQQRNEAGAGGASARRQEAVEDEPQAPAGRPGRASAWQSSSGTACRKRLL